MAQSLLHFDPYSFTLICQGMWTIDHLVSIKKIFNQISWPTQGTVLISGNALLSLDSSGALLINQFCQQLKDRGLSTQLEGFSERYHTLLQMTETKLSLAAIPPQPRALERLGRKIVEYLLEFNRFLAFLGESAQESLALICKPWTIRWSYIFAIFEIAGYRALGLIGLLAFLIGIVLSYQMGLQLRNYGADIYIVDLLGLAILREFGPLVTAILVAGRTGSAFTAEIGAMKLNQELDALRILGISVTESLVFPRMLALALIMPLLTIWFDLFAILGGTLMSQFILKLSFIDFINRFETQISLKTLWIGLMKAPLFGLIIASIGCFQGLNTAMRSDAIGSQTTRSVVLSIFFVIVVDALFSVILSDLSL